MLLFIGLSVNYSTKKIYTSQTMEKMTVIRVSEDSARKLRFFGKTYEDSVKALLARTDPQTSEKIDYDKIRGIVSDEIAKASQY
jgi:hypothetical protein